MIKCDINVLVNNKYLCCDDIQKYDLYGEIDELKISDLKYDKLDLSNVKINKLSFIYLRKSNKNCILPNSLEKLSYYTCFGVTEIPKLSENLKLLYCRNIGLEELPILPNSLEKLICNFNKLKKLPNLPDSLETLICSHNNLEELPNLPDSLKELIFDHNNNLITLPKLPDNIKLFIDDGIVVELDYLAYNNTNINKDSKFNIKIKNTDIRINSYEKYIKYMEMLFMNKMKSARK